MLHSEAWYSFITHHYSYIKQDAILHFYLCRRRQERPRRPRDSKLGRVNEWARKKIGRRKVKNAKKNGALLCVLDLFSPDFSLARLDFSPPQLTAPGSPRMRQENKPTLSVYIFSQCQCFVLALINHTKFLKFMLLSQSIHVSNKPSSIVSCTE